MGTAAQKIAYLNETKELIKESLNTNFNSQIEDTDTFRSYVSKISDLYINWPKVEGEGTNLTLNNTRKGKMSIDLNGNDLSQFTTTGKNKLNSLGTYSAGTTRTSNGVNYTFNKNGSITINGTATGTSFALLIGSNLNDYQTTRFLINEDYVVGNWNNNNIQLTTRGTDGEYRTIYKGSNTTGIVDIKNIPIGVIYVEVVNGTTINETIYPQIELGNTQTSYEKFTGGNPAPNPDYPQDVDVVSGNNSIKVEGKNYCNGINQNVYLNNTTNQYGVASNNSGLYIQVSGGNYTISTTKTQERYRVACSNNEPSTVPQTSYRGQNKDNTSNSITIDTTGYSYLIVNATNLSAIQIEKGSTATTYEPYESQTYPINLGTMELCKIGNYQDYIYKDNGKWYKHSEIGKRIFNGTENWYENANNIQATLSSITFTSNSECFSNYFKSVLYSSSEFGISVYQSGNTPYVRVNQGKTKIGGLSTFKAWLSSHNTTLYYPLATSTNTEITDQTLIAQLDNFEKAKSYNSQTNISQENNDLPFIINATALMGNSD